MNKLYAAFQTSKNLEKEGIIIEYPGARIKIARAGGSNANFAKVLDRLTRPYKRAIANDTLDLETNSRIMRECYAQAVVMGWESQKEDTGEWVPGIMNGDGDIVEVSMDSIIKAFTELPDLFIDLQQQAAKAALFLKHIDLEDAKN